MTYGRRSAIALGIYVAFILLLNAVPWLLSNLPGRQPVPAWLFWPAIMLPWLLAAWSIGGSPARTALVSGCYPFVAGFLAVVATIGLISVYGAPSGSIHGPAEDIASLFLIPFRIGYLLMVWTPPILLVAGVIVWACQALWRALRRRATT